MTRPNRREKKEGLPASVRSTITPLGGDQHACYGEPLPPQSYAADARHQVPNLKPSGPSPSSTLGPHQAGQIRPINAQSAPPLQPISFPARPISGGRLELAPSRRGTWWAEPKYNGWRALVHCPSRSMWNRHGARLSIEGEFGPALRSLHDLVAAGVEWADCEALERRHSIGRGTLVVLDFIPSAPLGYEERREAIVGLIQMERLSLGEWDTMPPDSLFVPPSIRDDGQSALAFYESLKSINRRLGAEFFEGVVMKRGGSRYPVQLRGAGETVRQWVKYRWG